MGRNIPSKEIITAPIHPLLSLAISVTWIAALVATISSLCGIWSKKSSKSSSKTDMKTTATITKAATDAQNSSSSSSSSSKGKSTNSADNNATTLATTTNDDGEITNRPLPPPPSAAKLEFGESAVMKKIDRSSSLKNYMSKTSTRRKLSSSISMKVSMKIKDKASDFKDKASGMKDKASDIKGKASEISHRKMKNGNESLWTKRIILGEKCKRPNEDDVNEVIVSYDDEQGSDDINDNDNGVASSGSYTRAMSRSGSSISGESVTSASQEEKLVRRGHCGKRKEKVQSDEEDDS